MGNTFSSDADVTVSETGREKNSRVLLFLHRTWAVIVTERWARTRVRQGRPVESDSGSDYDSQYSQYSLCTCSQCQQDDGFSSGCDSILFGSGSSMAPNSEEFTRVGQFPFMEETSSKEKQRPPIYNPEDYALLLKKWGKKPSNGNFLSLYSPNVGSDTECSRSQNNTFRDYRNPMLLSAGSEMTLRQFGTVSELLTKLKCDLKLAYPSFVQEFVSDPLDGITLLLDLLRAIQLSQSNSGHATGTNNTTGKLPPSLQRRALLDELTCLQCLISCCTRYSDSVRKLTASSAGLFTLAICIMSNVNKSRIVALQLLTKACEPIGNGHAAVSEALSTLRLRFGEPVRFRFLVGMITSTGGHGELLACGMKFLNTFLDTAASQQKRLYIQAELEQAGFDIAAIKKNIAIKSSCSEEIFIELDRWEKKHIDVESLLVRMKNAERETGTLRDKVLLLERRIQILQEEKGILMSLEQCLKDRCSELQDEVHSLKSNKSTKSSSPQNKDDNQPAEDEGISSSDRSITPEELHCTPSIYEVYSNHSEAKTTQRDGIQPFNSGRPPILAQEEEEETTIEEVMEELRNIINDAETENLKKEEMKKEVDRRRIEEAQVASKIQMHVGRAHIDLDDFAIGHENEIIPSNLHPHPPRKSRSLVHLFMPTEDYEYNHKEMFFENETAFTSDESSDSLLSASRCRLPRVEKNAPVGGKDKSDGRQQNHYKEKHCNKNLFRRFPMENSVKKSDSFKYLATTDEKENSYDASYYITSVYSYQQQDKQCPTVMVDSKSNNHTSITKSKSLDRIDDGLGAMVDIVVTNDNGDKITTKFNTNQDAVANSNVNGTSLSRSISNIFIGSKKEFKSQLSSHSEDKQIMFLPPQKDFGDLPYYFPRLQEKRNTSTFLIKRGHGNAGMYSGQAVASHHTSLNINNEYLASGTGCKVNGKVTDLPSGLY